MSKLTYTPTNILRPAPVAVAQLAYDRETYTFSAEASSLKGFGRVYNDSCDMGFTIVGKREQVVFVVTDEEIVDGELRFTTLKSIDGFFTAIIFND